MSLAELAALDGLGLAELVRRKELTPLELVDWAIDNIERVNGRLNAVVTKMYDQAREAARNPLPDGHFTGVPFLLKDILAFYSGVRETLGTKLLANFVPNHDSELVIRLKKAGLIVIGRTNVPELGLTPTTESVLLGACRNPWNTGRTSGGSSGGSAAAVAAGMVPMAHGSDGGGSIRIPAACCGLFGLKPTRGRNPMGPDFGDQLSGLLCEHALTRSVRDSAALLDATSGPDIGDPYWAPPKARPFLDEVSADPGRLRIAFTTQATVKGDVHPDCIAAVEDAAKLCERLGHDLTEARPTIMAEALMSAFMTVWSAGAAAVVESIAGRSASPEMFEALTWTLAQKGRGHTAPQYLIAVGTLQKVSRDVARFFEDYDVLLTPTLALPPVELGWINTQAENIRETMIRITEFSPYTPLVNATGQPAMNVPLFWNQDGLPIGTHFVGRFGDEATLFRLAAQLERARPWANRRPAVWV